MENVINLGSFRAKLTRSWKSDKDFCEHRSVIVDRDQGIIECADCKKTVSAFVVLNGICDRWAEIEESVKTQKRRAAEMRTMLKRYKVRLRAAREMERRWWHSSMLPACPHCRRGLMAEDFAEGAGTVVGREYEIAMRIRDGKKIDRTKAHIAGPHIPDGAA